MMYVAILEPACGSSSTLGFTTTVHQNYAIDR